ncbi:MAG: molybdopterin molybdotransferase MoeA [Armatimonadota bacterium]
MIPLAEAFAIIDEQLSGVRLPAETVATQDACNRVLAVDQTSRLDLPPFNKSAMDGYAVMGDERDTYTLVETVAAGETPQTALSPGEAVAVMTGAAVPEGSEKIILVEHTDRDGDTIRVHRHPSRSNICIRGEDIAATDTVLPAGTRLAPHDIANLISCGVTEVGVVQKPRVAVICTGNEIVDDPEELKPGRIMNANGPSLHALSEANGLEVVSAVSVGDERDVIGDAIEKALTQADIVVLSGGVSMGEFDFVIEAMEDAELTVHFTRVAVKPGKPMTFASGGQKAVFGLPGNPVSVYLTFHLHVLRAARLMSGAKPDLHQLSVPLACEFTRKKGGRRGYTPGRIDHQMRLWPVEYHGSAHLLALSDADGFFAIPQGVTELPAGERVDFLPLLMRLP